MALAHDILKAAAKVALEAQTSVITNMHEVSDERHRRELVEVSGLFNKIAADIYRRLMQLERDEDGETEQ